MSLNHDLSHQFCEIGISWLFSQRDRLTFQSAKWLLCYAGRLFVRGSEGGHTDFAPVDEEQLALLAWMQKKKQPVSYEMLIAGPGLAKLYDFCKEYHQIPESAWIVEAMNEAKNRCPI